MLAVCCVLIGCNLLYGQQDSLTIEIITQNYTIADAGTTVLLEFEVANESDTTYKTLACTLKVGELEGVEFIPTSPNWSNDSLGPGKTWSFDLQIDINTSVQNGSRIEFSDGELTSLEPPASIACTPDAITVRNAVLDLGPHGPSPDSLLIYDGGRFQYDFTIENTGPIEAELCKLLLTFADTTGVTHVSTEGPLGWNVQLSPGQVELTGNLPADSIVSGYLEFSVGCVADSSATIKPVDELKLSGQHIDPPITEAGNPIELYEPEFSIAYNSDDPLDVTVGEIFNLTLEVKNYRYHDDLFQVRFIIPEPLELIEAIGGEIRRDTLALWSVLSPDIGETEYEVKLKTEPDEMIFEYGSTRIEIPSKRYFVRGACGQEFLAEVDTHTINALRPILELGPLSAPDFVDAGETVVYSMEISNTGEAEAKVELSFRVPDEYIGGGDWQNTDLSVLLPDNTITWEETFTVVNTIPDGRRIIVKSGAQGDLSVTAKGWSAKYISKDDTTVVSNARLEADLTTEPVSGSLVDADSCITYTMKLKNNGSDTAWNCILYASSPDTNWTVIEWDSLGTEPFEPDADSNGVTWELGDLPEKESVLRSLIVRTKESTLDEHILSFGKDTFTFSSDRWSDVTWNDTVDHEVVNYRILLSDILPGEPLAYADTVSLFVVVKNTGRRNLLLLTAKGEIVSGDAVFIPPDSLCGEGTCLERTGIDSFIWTTGPLLTEMSDTLEVRYLILRGDEVVLNIDAYGRDLELADTSIELSVIPKGRSLLKVGLFPNPYPGVGDAEIRYVLTEDVNRVAYRVIDIRGVVVAGSDGWLSGLGISSAGLGRIEWKCIGKGGTLLPNGTYFLEFTVESLDGTEKHYQKMSVLKRR